jgi:peptide/nickel transport system permease protein
VTLLGSGLVLVVLIMALMPSTIAPANPVRIALSDRLRGPSASHLFGTDDFGRDLFSRVVHGARISLLSGIAVIATSVAVGVVVGVAAGYRGGWGDEALMRLTDMFMAFPPILLAMAIVAALRPSLANTTLALVLVWWPAYARLVRSQVLALKERAFVESAVSLGAVPLWVVRRHLLPNAMAPIIVQATMDMGYVVLAAASLGFLGLGAQPPAPEWGKMISDGRRYFLEAWWYPVFPGLAIATTVLGFNLIGDDLRDWLDPRTRPVRA